MVAWGGAGCLAAELDPGSQVRCCGQFADALVATDGLHADITEAVCEVATALLGVQLEDLLESLDTVNSSSLTLATSQPCQCYDNDADMTVDRWGAPAAPCTWTTTSGVSGDPVDSELWGTKQQ